MIKGGIHILQKQSQQFHGRIKRSGSQPRFLHIQGTDTMQDVEVFQRGTRFHGGLLAEEPGCLEDAGGEGRDQEEAEDQQGRAE